MGLLENIKSKFFTKTEIKNHIIDMISEIEVESQRYKRNSLNYKRCRHNINTLKKLASKFSIEV